MFSRMGWNTDNVLWFEELEVGSLHSCFAVNTASSAVVSGVGEVDGFREVVVGSKSLPKSVSFVNMDNGIWGRLFGRLISIRKFDVALSELPA